VRRPLGFSPFDCAQGEEGRLRGLGATHVINLERSDHNREVWQFRALWLPFRDDKAARPAWFYRRTLRFYRRAMRRGSKLFVMCHQGICRSASLAYFLLRASHRSPAMATGLVLQVRASAYLAKAYRESAEQFLSRRKK
jgi:protein-tyrosine phosphatase